MGIAKESTGSYQPGFATFGILAAVAFILVATLHPQWLAWALPAEANLGLEGPVAMAESLWRTQHSGGRGTLARTRGTRRPARVADHHRRGRVISLAAPRV
jgi:hypothetical protein